MKFAANVSLIFAQLPFADRITSASDAGFEAVEIYWPQPEELPATAWRRFADQLEQDGTSVVQLNFTTGDRPGIDAGVAGEPDRAEMFRRNVPEALELAAQLGCRRINALAGKRIAGVDPQRQRATLLDSLATAADQARPHGISIMVEALNRVDWPDYLLPDTRSAIRLLDELARDNVKLLFDVYHSAMNGEDPVELLAEAGPRLGNVQLADVPGRHEPGSGSLPIAPILAEVGRQGYRDWVGCEYLPRRPESAAADLAATRELLGEIAP